MEHYVTLFDSLFLPQGVALHKSMERHIQEYTLWILCVDDEAYTILVSLHLPNVRLLLIENLETLDLQRVKPLRTKGEYCWTLTPFAPRFIFETDLQVKRVTYLDADMWFRATPKPIFEEFDKSGKCVLITDHAYAPEHDQSATSGKYCVQFMTFTREGSEIVRKWWEDRCIDWCYARFEDGKFGDQKYLDDWPMRFGKYVHVLSDKRLLMAPWNSSRFQYQNAICWHFHGLRIIRQGTWLGVAIFNYNLSKLVIEKVYMKHVDDLSLSINLLSATGYVVRTQHEISRASRIMSKIRGILRGKWHGNFIPLN